MDLPAAFHPILDEAPVTPRGQPAAIRFALVLRCASSWWLFCRFTGGCSAASQVLSTVQLCPEGVLAGADCCCTTRCGPGEEGRGLQGGHRSPQADVHLADQCPGGQRDGAGAGMGPHQYSAEGSTCVVRSGEKLLGTAEYCW